MHMHQQIIAIVSLALLFGCASQQAKTNTAATNSPASAETAQKAKSPTATAEPATAGVRKVKSKEGLEGEIVGTPAAKSKFAKLQIGMPQRQVEDLIGAPSDMKTYVTGKAWIPFYFGKDTYRFETFYKHEGRLTFEGGSVTGSSGKLIRITVDTSEDGYQ
jgi:hypothetical protein